MQDVGEILAQLYASEINCRLEWCWDGGYVWVLVGPNGAANEQNVSRVEMDDLLSGMTMIATVDPEAVNRAQRLMRDWLDRGTEDTIEKAVEALAISAAKRYSQSAFADWWNARAVFKTSGQS